MNWAEIFIVVCASISLIGSTIEYVKNFEFKKIPTEPIAWIMVIMLIVFK